MILIPFLKQIVMIFYTVILTSSNSNTLAVNSEIKNQNLKQTNPAPISNSYDAEGNSFARNFWLPDETGIHYKKGAVGIGTDSKDGSLVSIQQIATNGHSSAMDIFSDDGFQTVTRFRNTTVNQEYQFNLAGEGNFDQHPGSFGIFHNNTLSWVWHTNPSNSFLGIGSYSHKQPMPQSRLHIFNGDVNIDEIGSGIIMKSPNGKCWRITVGNDGNLITEEIIDIK